jgi:hypothetical protein
MAEELQASEMFFELLCIAPVTGSPGPEKADAGKWVLGYPFRLI